MEMQEIANPPGEDTRPLRNNKDRFNREQYETTDQTSGFERSV